MSGTVPQLRFPGFDGEWESTTVGEIGPVAMCKRVMKEQTSPEGDIPFFKIGTFGKDADAFIDRKLFENFRKKYSYPKFGDILISAAGTIGRLVVFDGNPAYFQDSNIVWVANDETRTLNPFLYYCYQNTRWTTEDTTIARLYNENLRGIEIVQPPLPEQQKIADFLGTVDAKLDALRRKKSGLEAFKSGLMQRLFSQELRFTQDDGTEFPDWEEVMVGDALTLSQIPGSGGDVARKLSVQLWARGVRESGRSGSASTRYYIRRAGQFIYSKLDFLNCAFGIVPDALDGLESTVDLPAFDISSGVVPEYLLNYVIRPEFYEQLGSTADGSRKAKRIQEDVFLGFPLMLPHPDEQRKIADALSALDAKIVAVAGQITHMETFKKGLLQQMFV